MLDHMKEMFTVKFTFVYALSLSWGMFVYRDYVNLTLIVTIM